MVLNVVGSNPTIHPETSRESFLNKRGSFFYYYNLPIHCPHYPAPRPRKHENKNTKAPQPVDCGAFVIHDIMWSWWESNPRPHKETICFLHAYSGLRFSSCDKTRTTNRSLSSKIFIPQPELPRNYFRFNLRRFAFGFGTTSSERRLVLLPCKRIKLVIYCASIKQREHTCCCQLFS